MKVLRIAVLVAALALPNVALAGPLTEGGFPTHPVFRPPTLQAPGSAQVHGDVITAPYGAEQMLGARYLGPAHLGTLGVNVVLQMRDEAGLQRYAAVVNDPHSLYYRRFLTPQQVGEFFGAFPSDNARVISYFYQQGLGVQSWAQREMVRVVGPQQLMERAFQTHFGLFVKNGIVFYAPTKVPRFLTALPVRGLGGMVTYRHFRKHFDIGASFVPFQGAGAGFMVGMSPFQISSAFDYTGAYNINSTCCKGDGITIGIVGTGPISSADVPFYRSLFKVSGTGTVDQVNVTAVMACCYSNGLTTPPPVTAPCSGPLPGCNPEDTEAQLDTEQTSSLAPDATVNFYLAYNPNECFAPGTCAPGAGSPQIGVAESDDELQQIANDNVADVVSGSYGIGELDFASPSNMILTCPDASSPTGCSGADPAIFATMASEGIAVFLSSGDTGAAGCQRDGGSPNVDKLCVSYPSGDPSVVSVGGTTTPIGSNGRLQGPITVWGVQTQTFGAGGGGFSAYFKRPAFEFRGSICASNKVCDTTHRLQPDVSLNADPATAPSVTVNCGTGASCAGLGGVAIGGVGGTSASAPAMAAMWALVLEACKQTTSCLKGTGVHNYRLGNPAPLLFSLSAAQRASSIYDVTFGFNAVPNTSSPDYSDLDPGFHAGVGYDAASGLGAPFARNLIMEIVGI